VTSTVSLYPTPAKVTILAATIATVAAEYQVPLVVDLGAGQAHLSHILAYHFGLDVLAIDNDASQTSGALRRQVKASKRAAKLQGAEVVVVACHGGERAGLTKCINALLCCARRRFIRDSAHGLAATSGRGGAPDSRHSRDELYGNRERRAGAPPCRARSYRTATPVAAVRPPHLRRPGVRHAAHVCHRVQAQT